MDILSSAALWSFVGGATYSGTRYTTAVWGGREIGPRAQRLALAQFVIALVVTPFAGHALTPIALDLFPRATANSSALMIGLAFNAVWPMLVEPKAMRTLAAELLSGLAGRIMPGGGT